MLNKKDNFLLPMLVRVQPNTEEFEFSVYDPRFLSSSEKRWKIQAFLSLLLKKQS